MRILRNTFLVSVKTEEKYKLKGTKDLVLWVDPDFNPYHQAVQWGIVTHVPETCDEVQKISNDYDPKAKREGIYESVVVEVANKPKVGDKIWFHHFVAQPENQRFIGDKSLFACDWFNIYLIERPGGELLPVGGNILAKWILEDESNSTITLQGPEGPLPLIIKGDLEGNLHRDVEKRKMEVTHVNENAEKLGIKPGYTVIINVQADYDLQMDKEVISVVKLKNVLAYFEGKESLENLKPVAT